MLELTVTKISPSKFEGDKSVLVSLTHQSQGVGGFGGYKKNYHISHVDGVGISIGQEIELDMSKFDVVEKTITIDVEGVPTEVKIDKLFAKA